MYFPFALFIFIIFIEFVLNSYSHRKPPSLLSVQSDIQYDLWLWSDSTPASSFYSNAVRDDIIDSNRWALKQMQEQGQCYRKPHWEPPAASTGVRMDGIQWVGWKTISHHGRVIESVIAVCFNNRRMAYLVAGWVWVWSLGKLCNREYMEYYHWGHAAWPWSAVFVRE